MKKIWLSFLLALWAYVLQAQTESLWQEIDEANLEVLQQKRLIKPDQYRVLQLNWPVLLERLNRTPMRFSAEASSGILPKVDIPLPEGGVRNFSIVEAPVMAAELAERYPGMRSFAGFSTEDPTAYLRFGITPKGFHAMVLSARHGTVYVDTYALGDTLHYVCYFKKDYHRPTGFICDTQTPPVEEKVTQQLPGEKLAGDCQLRTYQLALACTGEYAQYHGGTKALVMAEYNTAMTRINGIFEREVGVTMVMVPNNDDLIFLNPFTDPYDNNDKFAMLAQNQSTCDAIIGNNNYDIGHVFCTGGGGVATLNSVCSSTSKARGVTGLSNPIGDPFYVDYVCHEIGHQFGANHTQNNNCNRHSTTAMEPGSGSTIMGYSGVCPPNVQQNSDDYFHAVSLAEISNFILGTGNSCATTNGTANNPPSVVVNATSYYVPVSTPLALKAIGADPDGDTITYCWEQMDYLVAPMPPQPTSTVGPAFRSLPPTESNIRYLPNLNAIINNYTPTWEVLPSVSRQMKWRCTVRDNAPLVGCSDEANLTLHFTDAAGPFRVNAPNSADTVWYAGLSATVTWDVANTDVAPVSCTRVDILLSFDGGYTYPFVLKSNTPNDGSEDIVVPLQLTSQARVMVRARNNIFFDISDENFSIEEPPAPTFVLTATPTTAEICPGDTAAYLLLMEPLLGFNEGITFHTTGLPAGLVARFEPSLVVPPASVELLVIDTLASTPGGTYSFTVHAVGVSQSKNIGLSLTILPKLTVGPVPMIPADGATGVAYEGTRFRWAKLPNATSYRLQVTTNPDFSTTIHSALYFDTTAFVPGLQANTVYYWRVRGNNSCGPSSYSPVFAFQTGVEHCETFTSGNLPLDISTTDTVTLWDSLAVSLSGQLMDVALSVDITHSWVGDLGMKLYSPSGTEILVFDQPGIENNPGYGCENDDIEATFYDDAPNPASVFEWSCNATPPAIGGDFKPYVPFVLLHGEPAGGTWKLALYDVFPEDGGTWNEGSLTICASEPAGTTPSVVTHTLEVNELQSALIDAQYLSASGVAPLTFIVLSEPQYGLLLLDGDTLHIGDEFTPQQVEAGMLSYQHLLADSLSDGFYFDLLTGDGGWLHDSWFAIMVIDNPLSGQAYISRPVSCQGEMDAEITIDISGGTPPYQYALEGFPPQPSPVFSGLGPGSYIPLVTDTNGFSLLLDTVIIEEPALLELIVQVSMDSALAMAAGGVPPYLFRIDGGPWQSHPLFTGLVNGVHVVEVQDSHQCEASTLVQVAVNTLQAHLELIEPILCAGDATGSLMIVGSGGTPPYQYSIDGVVYQSDPSFTGLAAGAYVGWVLDSEGFTLQTDTLFVVEPPALSATATVTGYEVSIIASGGTTPYQFGLDGGGLQGDPVFFPVIPGMHLAEVVDANDCQVSLPVEVVVAPLVVTAQVQQYVTCPGGNDGVIEANASGGVGPYEFSLDGIVFQSDPLFTGLTTGTYIITIRDAGGFTATSSEVVIFSPPILDITYSVIGTTLEVNATGGTPPYLYSLDGGSFQSETQLPILFNGMHTLEVLDASGCTSTFDFWVQVQAPHIEQVQVTNNLCPGDSTGMLEVIATCTAGPCEFSIDGVQFQAGSQFDGLTAGIYTVFVRDALGSITTSGPHELTSPPAITLNHNVTGLDVEFSAAGGTPPYEYSMDGSGFLASPFFQINYNGIHTVEVRDANGCTRSFLVDLFVPGPMIQSLTATAISCHGDSIGTIMVVAFCQAPPCQFSIDGVTFQDEPLFEGLAAGSYTIEVIDELGSTTLVGPIEIVEPAPLDLEASAFGPVISTSAAGGTPPYQFSLDGLTYQADSTFYTSENGNFTVYVLDANGCSSMVETTVNAPRALLYEVEGVSCAGSNDGSIELTGVDGGFPPFAFSLNGGPFSAEVVFDSLAPGTYYVVIQDSTGYLFDAPPIVVMAPDSIEVETVLEGDTLFVMAFGGTGQLMYSLDSGLTFQPSPMFPGLSNGTYQLVVRDENDCQVWLSVEVIIDAVREVDPSYTIQLYPNPAGAEVRLRIDPPMGAEGEISLLSVTGELIYRQNLTTQYEKEHLIDLHDLPAGTYLMVFKAPAMAIAKRLIVLP